MRTPDWRNLVLGEGILSEPPREDNRVVLWLPTNRDREFQYWERIGTVPRGEIQAELGICAMPATSIRARQRLRVGFLGKLTRKLVGAGGEESWTLPNGQAAERAGERKTDLALAWPQDDFASLSEEQARTRWPGLTRFQKLGQDLFLVAGVGAEPAAEQGPKAPSGVKGTEELGSPVALAEQLLEAARQSGDQVREAAALTDLGIVFMNEGDLKKSVAHLEKALGLARQLGDLGREVDVLNNMGYALLAMGQPLPARQWLEHGLLLARQLRDPYAEKLILERLGMAHLNVRDAAGAMSLLNRALEMTRAMGDRQQETRVLWNQAIAFAELNQRDQAIARAEESLDVLRKLGKPEASWYGAQLQRYRMDFSGLKANGPGSSIITTGQPASDPNSGPGLLRMAVSATRAMMKFIGSGLKTTAPDVQQKRMATCQACTHHTGLRCRICGCFTNVKTRMAHEQCPIGKWPA